MKGYVWAWVLIQSSCALVLFHNFGALVLWMTIFLFAIIIILITQVCALCFYFCEQEEYYQVGTSA
jgi:hypothetical protein